MLPALCLCLVIQTSPIVVSIDHGKFSPRRLKLLATGTLSIENHDATPYTVESPGLFAGDVIIPPKGKIEVSPLYEAGTYTAMIEETPNDEITIDFEGRPVDDPLLRETPFDAARRRDRQPLLFEPGAEPAYGAFTTFNISVKGEAARQSLLKDLYRLQEQLSDDRPPTELAAYFTPESWQRLCPSVALIVGLGPTAYDARRFSPKVAYSRPKGLHPFMLGPKVQAPLSPTKDLIVRATSDSHWFNLRVCRLVWSRLKGRIAAPTLESGYAPPRGRSPILGGFFDGIGNPSGADRERAAYAGGNGSYLSYFRIAFDEARFAKLPRSAQEALVGRTKTSGHLVKGSLNSHRERAQNDGKSLIVRMPFIFDDGPSETGLLFTSAQASIDRQFERILSTFMLPKPHRDSLLSYMKFESAAYYYIPPSPRGSFPGSLRGL